MKKVIILLAVVILSSCAKQETKPIRSSEEINAQYEIKYGYVTFWSNSDELLVVEITNNNAYESKTESGHFVVKSQSEPSCDVFGKHRLSVGDQSYTIYSTKTTSENKLISDKVVYTGKVTIVEGSCQLIKL